VGELLARWGPAAPGPDLRGWEWYYLDSLARQAALTLRGHVGAVRAVAYTRDGKRLATGGDDQTVRIWDTASGRELACLRGHTGAVLGVAWSPDGAHLATASGDGTARIWDVISGQELGQIKGPGLSVTAVAWRPDGARVATTGHDRHVFVWDTNTGRDVVNRRMGSAWGMAVAWSPDGKKLAFGSWIQAMVLDGETGAELANLRGHRDGVLGVSWSPSGDRLATASWDSTVRIWDPSTGKESAVLSGAGSNLYAVCWSPDGKQIAAGGGNRAVQIWDADTRRARTVLRGNQGDVWALAWSPDGSSLAATSEEGVTRLWDVRPGSAPGPGQVRPGGFQAGLSPDGTRIAVVRENDPRVRILDSVSGNLLRALGGTLPGRLWKTRWSPDGTRVACSGWGWALVVWDVQTGEQVLPVVGQDGGRHFALAWSAAGDRVATGDDRGQIRVWDSSSGRKLLEISCGAEVWDLSWSPDGRQIASARWDGVASVWDVATGSEVLALRGHSGRVVSVGWSPDGKRIATGSYDCTVKLWDPATRQETLTLRGHASLVREVHWHPEGGRLTTLDRENNELTWDAMPAFLAERSATSLRALTGRIERDPADTTARRLRAEVLARQGDWNAAALEFSELARLPASAAAVYPAGWWALAGPEDRPPAFPPPAGAAPARWLAPADDPNGFVALPADGTTAVGRVFAPRPKVVALDIDPVPPGRLWLNEKAIGAAARGPILVELREGWNSLALGGRPGELYVRWRDFDKPADNAERLTLAQIAFEHKQFTAATRLWAEALEIDSKVGGNRRAQYRYKAARAAVLAAAGHDTNEPPLDDAAKARLRRQALDWLKAELAAWSKRLEPGSRASRPAIARALSDWMQDPDLAGVRDTAALARFPEADRKEWQALWARFRDLMSDVLFPDDPFAPAVSLPKPDGGRRAKNRARVAGAESSTQRREKY
jgi:WD40 repeat protein